MWKGPRHSMCGLCFFSYVIDEVEYDFFMVVIYGDVNRLSDRRTRMNNVIISSLVERYDYLKPGPARDWT